jgi:hypothetical protein
VAICAVASAAVGSKLPPPRAFDRVPVRADALPERLGVFINARFGKITGSRRVATYTDGRGRNASVYLLKTNRQMMCMVSIGLGSGAGGGCSPSNAFIAGNRYLNVAESGRLVIGVVRATVARVVIVGPRGSLHPVKVTPDGGFIYDCHAYNGCTGAVVKSVRVYDSGGRILEARRLP